MKRILLIIAAVALLPSCKGTMPPLSLAYTGQAGGHDITAGYSTTDGIAVAAEKLKVTGQK